MTYDQAKAVALRHFDRNPERYKIEVLPRAITEHISIWYGWSDAFQRDMIIDRYVIEYRHVTRSANGRILYDKEKKAELRRVAPYMLERILEQQCK